MMSYHDPFDPRRRPASPRSAGRSSQRMPTIEDYQQLVIAYRESQAELQQLKSDYQALVGRAETANSRQDELDRLDEQVHALEQELTIKNEALHKQGEALKETENELLWERAARQKLEEKLDQEDEPSWQEKFTRLQADMENMRRRWEQRKEQEVAGERNRILLDMLPLADHLDLALAHSGNLDDETTREFVKNIEATRHAFMDALKRYGIERIEAQGEPFDPSFHEAVGQEPSANVPADHVTQELQAGYRDGDQVVRPARVMVSSG